MGFLGFSRNDSLRNRHDFTEIDPRTPIAKGLWRGVQEMGRGWRYEAHDGLEGGNSGTRVPVKARG
jgi:hypothetical protein